MATETLLERTERVLREEVAPKAEAMDGDPEALAEGLAVLAREGLLALKRPKEFGGPELPDPEIRRFQEIVARVSGALAFLQTQHQGVSGMLAGSSNRALAEEYLPHMHDGSRLVGVGFSQLRRPGPPIVRAERVDGGYRIEGNVPWVTGFGFYQEFVVGAALPDGQAVFGLVPLREEPNVHPTPPMRLAAMSAAGTVAVQLDGFFLPDDRVIAVREAGWISNSDAINIAQQGTFALGCAQAGLDVLARNAERRKLEFAATTHESLQGELDATRAEAEYWAGNASVENVDARLDLRARMIDLMVRCAHAGVVSSSGAANSVNHPAQRIFREAMVFSVSAQTGPIMEATLNRLVAREPLRAECP
jgi:alkylation response protein AidB-like acyl-CoA dehydrogenase